MSDILLCVDPAKIDQFWPHVAPLIERAFASGLGDDNPETVKFELVVGDALLWIVWDGRHLIAAATTKLMQTPTKKLCVVTSCAGKELKRFLPYLHDLEKYAMDEGCDVMRVMGRRGWQRVLYGYHEPWVCLEKELN